MSNSAKSRPIPTPSRKTARHRPPAADPALRPQWLGAKEAAFYASLSVSYVALLMQRQVIPSFVHGRRRLCTWDDFARWLETQRDMAVATERVPGWQYAAIKRTEKEQAMREQGFDPDRRPRICPHDRVAWDVDGQPHTGTVLYIENAVAEIKPHGDPDRYARVFVDESCLRVAEVSP